MNKTIKLKTLLIIACCYLALSAAYNRGKQDLRARQKTRIDGLAEYQKQNYKQEKMQLAKMNTFEKTLYKLKKFINE